MGAQMTSSAAGADLTIADSYDEATEVGSKRLVPSAVFVHDDCTFRGWTLWSSLLGSTSASLASWLQTDVK
jgi:hypothetical protein